MFSWDTQKAIRNFEKHGVSFEEGATVFADSEALDWADQEHSTAEVRFKRLGRSVSERILIVVYTMRELKNGKETIRIISARAASRKERKAFLG
jgi:uncharacterized DUF497 family protein